MLEFESAAVSEINKVASYKATALYSLLLYLGMMGSNTNTNNEPLNRKVASTACLLGYGLLNGTVPLLGSNRKTAATNTTYF